MAPVWLHSDDQTCRQGGRVDVAGGSGGAWRWSPDSEELVLLSSLIDLRHILPEKRSAKTLKLHIY